MIEVKNLEVKFEDKKILDDVSFVAKTGEVTVIMGPNGSGKSTLAHAIMGNPKFNVSGKIILDKKDVSKLSVDKRAKEGIFLSFQHPEEFDGVKVSHFLRMVFAANSKEKISILEFNKRLKEKMQELNIDTKFVSRSLNNGFSGGEKKKMEILQLSVINPKVVILDETDSGLDVDALKKVCDFINEFKKKNKTIILITHYKRVLYYLNADKIFVLKEGRIVKEGTSELADQIEMNGFDSL